MSSHNDQQKEATNLTDFNHDVARSEHEASSSPTTPLLTLNDPDYVIVDRDVDAPKELNKSTNFVMESLEDKFTGT